MVKKNNLGIEGNISLTRNQRESLWLSLWGTCHPSYNNMVSYNNYFAKRDVKMI
jgi:hypothetical protein